MAQLMVYFNVTRGSAFKQESANMLRTHVGVVKADVGMRYVYMTHQDSANMACGS